MVDTIRSRSPIKKHRYSCKDINIETIIFADGNFSFKNGKNWDCIKYEDQHKFNKIYYEGQQYKLYEKTSGRNDYLIKKGATLFLDRHENNKNNLCVYRGLITDVKSTGKIKEKNNNKYTNIYELEIDRNYIHNGIKPNTILERYDKGFRPEYWGAGSGGIKRSACERLGFIITYNQSLTGIINVQ